MNSNEFSVQLRRAATCTDLCRVANDRSIGISANSCHHCNSFYYYSPHFLNALNPATLFRECPPVESHPVRFYVLILSRETNAPCPRSPLLKCFLLIQLLKQWALWTIGSLWPCLLCSSYRVTISLLNEILGRWTHLTKMAVYYLIFSYKLVL